MCRELYDSCNHDNNCCSKYCNKSTLWLRSFCEESNYIQFPGEISSIGIIIKNLIYFDNVYLYY